MIKHSITSDLVHVFIEKADFSYRIPLGKISNTIDWKIGGKETKGIVIKNVSAWALQLFTKNLTEEKYVKQFQAIVTEYSAKNDINWQDTLLAVNIQNQYNWMLQTNAADKKKLSEEEIIGNLKKRYNVG